MAVLDLGVVVSSEPVQFLLPRPLHKHLILVVHRLVVIGIQSLIFHIGLFLYDSRRCLGGLAERGNIHQVVVVCIEDLGASLAKRGCLPGRHRLCGRPMRVELKSICQRPRALLLILMMIVVVARLVIGLVVLYSLAEVVCTVLGIALIFEATVKDALHVRLEGCRRVASIAPIISTTIVHHQIRTEK